MMLSVVCTHKRSKQLLVKERREDTAETHENTIARGDEGHSACALATKRNSIIRLNLL